jgi:hypothetical protein
MKYLVRLAKSFVPAGVKTAVIRWRHPHKHYSNRTAAVAAAKETYASDSLTAFRIARAKKNSGREATMVNPPPALLARIEGTASFVDVGGSTGELCIAIQQRFPNCHFTVVENTALVAAASDVRANISFADTLPNSFDIFCSSGTLHIWRSLTACGAMRFLARHR